MENKLYIIKCVDYKSGSKEYPVTLDERFVNFKKALKFAKYLKTLHQPMTIELMNGLLDIGFDLDDICGVKDWLLYHYVEIWDFYNNECVRYTEEI